MLHISSFHAIQDFMKNLWIPNVFVYNLNSFTGLDCLKKLAGLWIVKDKDLFYNQVSLSRNQMRLTFMYSKRSKILANFIPIAYWDLFTKPANWHDFLFLYDRPLTWLSCAPWGLINSHWTNTPASLWLEVQTMMIPEWLFLMIN